MNGVARLGRAHVFQLEWSTPSDSFRFVASLKRGLGRAGALALVTALAPACEREIERPGQLIVAIDTDMALPQQVDQLHLQVEVNGSVAISKEYDVGPRTRGLIPATINLIGERHAGDPVTVKIAGSKATSEGLSWRTYREATVPIPLDRIATLRMPIQWLCKGEVESANGPDDGSPLAKPRAKSTCEPGNTCRAGRCEWSEVDESSLPDYAAEDLYGGGSTPETGSCFDTLGCMGRGRTVIPDDACSIPRPETSKFNVALRVRSDGICDEDGLNCFVPLDADSREGWEEHGDRLRLPPAVCEKLADGLVLSVVVADECQPKTNSVPTCGPWSSVPKGKPGEYRPSGAVMTGPSVLAKLPEVANAERCCPLMAAENKLFACVCAGASNGTVFAIDPERPGEPISVGTLNPSEMRKEPLAASVRGGALYWAAGREIRRTPLAGSSVLASGLSIPAPAALYETGSLLTDQTRIYALASGGNGAGDASVQLFAIPLDGSSVPPAVPIGNAPVFQFDHDDEAVYLARDQDLTMGDQLRRSSSVIRIDKRSGLQSTRMPERVLMLSSRERGGYVGVQAQQGSVFGLFEAIDTSGRARVELLATPVDAPASAEPTKLYELAIDPARTRVRMLGVAEGHVLLTLLHVADDSVQKASLLSVPATQGEARVIADFTGDFPVDGLAADAQRIYWLNSSGALYALPRSAVR